MKYYTTCRLDLETHKRLVEIIATRELKTKEIISISEMLKEIIGAYKE